MGNSDAMKITVSKDGPYIVSGNVTLSMQIITPNEEGLFVGVEGGENISDRGRRVQSLPVRSF